MSRFRDVGPSWANAASPASLALGVGEGFDAADSAEVDGGEEGVAVGGGGGGGALECLRPAER